VARANVQSVAEQTDQPVTAHPVRAETDGWDNSSLRFDVHPILDPSGRPFANPLR
jgi:hypothetical protein